MINFFDYDIFAVQMIAIGYSTQLVVFMNYKRNLGFQTFFFGNKH